MKRTGIALPPLVSLAFITTLLACGLGGINVLGFRVAGWAWVVMFGSGALVVITAPGRMALPLGIWLPWGAVLLVYRMTFSYAGGTQMTAQLLCPIVVAGAASTLRLTEAQISLLFKWMRAATVVLGVIVVSRVPMVLLLRLPAFSDLAPHAMVAVLFGTAFIVSGAFGRGRDLWYYLFLALIPIVALTRTAMGVVLSLAAVTFAPVHVGKRLLLGAVIAVVALYLFHTPRVQKMMFHSGAGTLTDMRLDNPDLATSGRTALWEMLYPGIRRRPWLGHGTAACTHLLISKGLLLRHPHNDWLRILYDFGIVGLSGFVISLFAQVWSLLRGVRQTTGGVRVLYCAAASAFVPFALIMCTDNILLYCQFYGNIHFLLVGLAYGSRRGVLLPLPAGTMPRVVA